MTALRLVFWETEMLVAIKNTRICFLYRIHFIGNICEGDRSSHTFWRMEMTHSSKANFSKSLSSNLMKFLKVLNRMVWYLDVLFTLFILHDHKDSVFVIFALEISMNLSWQKGPSVCCSLTISLWIDRLLRKEKCLGALDLIRLEKSIWLKFNFVETSKLFIYNRVYSFCWLGLWTQSNLCFAW